MNILKVLGVVVGLHLIAYLVFAQQGCRSTAAKPSTKATAAVPAAPITPQPVEAGELQPAADLSPISLNLPFAQTPPPAGDRYAPTRPGSEPAPVLSTPAKTYTVQKGDSFDLIARKNGVTVAELTAANNLTAKSALRPGQKLVVPVRGSKAAVASAPASSLAPSSYTPAAAPVAGGATYTVKSGDTLSKIASRNHTTAAALRTLNGISGDHLKIGQVLQLPGNGSAPAAARTVAPAPAPAPVPTRAAPVAAPSGPGVHTVGVGETAESIARKYQISVGELVRANQITDPKRIRIGQVLNIPGAGASFAAKPPPSLVPDRIVPSVTAPVGPQPGQDLDAGLPADAGPAPVVPVDEPAPATPIN